MLHIWKPLSTGKKGEKKTTKNLVLKLNKTDTVPYTKQNGKRKRLYCIIFFSKGHLVGKV